MNTIMNLYIFILFISLSFISFGFFTYKNCIGSHQK